MNRTISLLLLAVALLLTVVLASQGTTIDLAERVANGAPGSTITVPPGTYELSAPLSLKPGMALVGAGPDKTILRASSTWIPPVDALPRQENPNAYLVQLVNSDNVRIANLTLTGPTLHGAIYANTADRVELSHLHIRDFRWSGVRTFRMNHLRVHDCEFVDAGGKFRWTGAALFTTYLRNSEFWNNRIEKSEGLNRNFYGFKGLEGHSNRFHHNDVRVNFSFEFPFKNDTDIEIDHNRFDGVISIPKFGGGPMLRQGYSFHIHHNWLRHSYALEWARNSAEIDHNLFDFDVHQDGGNLIASFGDEPAPGPTDFHDNLIRNPGRGLFWASAPYNRLRFYNNHVKANGQSRQSGFFGFHPGTDFSTIEIRDNIFENTAANPRPLMRNPASYGATVENNTLVNIADGDRLTNRATGATRGPRTPLQFAVGVEGAFRVEGWNAR